MPVFIGYLVVLSPVELDVDVVYTANTPGDLTAGRQCLDRCRARDGQARLRALRRVANLGGGRCHDLTYLVPAP